MYWGDKWGTVIHAFTVSCMSEICWLPLITMLCQQCHIILSVYSVVYQTMTQFFRFVNSATVCHRAWVSQDSSSRSRDYKSFHVLFSYQSAARSLCLRLRQQTSVGRLAVSLHHATPLLITLTCHTWSVQTDVWETPRWRRNSENPQMEEVPKQVQHRHNEEKSGLKERTPDDDLTHLNYKL